MNILNAIVHFKRVNFALCEFKPQFLKTSDSCHCAVNVSMLWYPVFLAPGTTFVEDWGGREMLYFYYHHIAIRNGIIRQLTQCRSSRRPELVFLQLASPIRGW